MMCCKHDNQENKDGKNGEHENCKKGHMKHMFLMILCCTLPIIAVFALPYFGANNNSIGRFLPYLMFLLCPLSHLFMMGGMAKNKKEHQ